MRDKLALYISVLVATTASSLALVLPAFSPMRVLWYYPLEHRWAFEIKANAVAMDWYGRTLLAVSVGALAFALSTMIFRRWRPEPRTAVLWLGWSMVAVFLAMGAYAYQLVLRHPTPEPLPSWYVPR